MNKQLAYAHMIMRKDFKSLLDLKEIKLPAGFTYRFYQSADMQGWAALETKVGEFNTIDEAIAYFSRVFMPYEEQLTTRMIFIFSEAENRIVATASVWYKVGNGIRYPLLHWVACDPEYQGLGLGKAVIIKALIQMLKVETGNYIYLHTQTWSYKAIGLYLKLGFRLTTQPLIDVKTDFNCISILKPVLDSALLQQLQALD